MRSARTILASAAIVAGGAMLVGAAAAPTGAREPAVSCAIRTTSRVEPAQLRLGDEARVTLAVRAACELVPTPLHLVLVLDASWTSSDQLEAMKAAARAIVAGLDLPTNPATEVGLVRYAGTADTACALTDDAAAVLACIDQVAVLGSGHSADAGVREALKVLIRGRPGFGSGDVHEAAVLFSAGPDPTGCAPLLAAANAAKGQGILLATVCAASCDAACVAPVATNPAYHHTLDDVPSLATQLAALQAQTAPVSIPVMDVDESLPPYVQLVAGSPQPPPSRVDETAGSIAWRLVGGAGEPVTVTYRVEPLEVGTYPIGRGAQGVVKDHLGGTHSFVIDVPSVTVRPACEVETRAHARPATARIGGRVDVTLFTRVDCTGFEKPLRHVALVLEASEAVAGDPIASLRRAAHGLVDAILQSTAVAPALAVVAFGDEAAIVCPLTSDAAALHACIESVQPGAGGTLDAGIRAGLHALRLGGFSEGDVMMVLSHGPGASGCGAATAAANEAKEAGVLLVTACVGPTCDHECLRSVATSPRHFFAAADPAALVAVLNRISNHPIACPWQATIADRFLPTMPLVSDSAQPPPVTIDPAGTTVTWRFEGNELSRGITMTYAVRPSDYGESAVSGGAVLQYEDCLSAGTVSFPVPSVRIVPQEIYVPFAAKTGGASTGRPVR